LPQQPRLLDAARDTFLTLRRMQRHVQRCGKSRRNRDTRGLVAARFYFKIIDRRGIDVGLRSIFAGDSFQYAAVGIRQRKSSRRLRLQGSLVWLFGNPRLDSTAPAPPGAYAKLRAVSAAAGKNIQPGSGR
jgi:hypothetical protein